MMFERLKVMITVNRISWNNNFRLNDFLFRSKVTKEVIKEVSLCISVLSRCKSPVFLLNFIKLNFSFLETDRVDFLDEKPFLEFVIVNRLDTQSLSAWFNIQLESLIDIIDTNLKFISRISRPTDYYGSRDCEYLITIRTEIESFEWLGNSHSAKSAKI